MTAILPQTGGAVKPFDKTPYSAPSKKKPTLGEIFTGLP
jgi:hypothetical protein